MRTFLAAGAAALLAIAGLVVWRSDRAGAVASVLTPAPPPLLTRDAAQPSAVPAVAPAAPAPSARSSEEKRLARYDRDRDGDVTRAEFLASRQKYFAKLDIDHDGKLSFDEYAVKTATRFEAADRSRDGRLTAAEFASTAIKRRTARCETPAADAREADG